MSGIYIPGMEMPTSCDECRFDNNVYCLAYPQSAELIYDIADGIPQFCPLISVPDHGRLIDADALEDYCHRQTKNKWNESAQTSWAYAYASFESDVEDAPTIIESEE